MKDKTDPVASRYCKLFYSRKNKGFFKMSKFYPIDPIQIILSNPSNSV